MRGLGKRMQFPLARSQGLLIENVDSEKVIFDEGSKHAHCLTPLAAIVFSRCDGETSPTELARIASGRLGDSVSEDDVQNALAQLQERHLLESQLPTTLSRRDMFHKGAAFGGRRRSCDARLHGRSKSRPSGRPVYEYRLYDQFRLLRQPRVP